MCTAMKSRVHIVLITINNMWKSGIANPGYTEPKPI